METVAFVANILTVFSAYSRPHLMCTILDPSRLGSLLVRAEIGHTLGSQVALGPPGPQAGRGNGAYTEGPCFMCVPELALPYLHGQQIYCPNSFVSIMFVLLLLF